jgi:L-lactate dehydrogenase complex protein LldG
VTATDRLESGDRAAFLDLLRRRAARGQAGPPASAGSAAPGTTSPHPPPAPSATAPEIGFHALDPQPDGSPADLVEVFAATATDQQATVHRIRGRHVPADLLRAIVADHDIATAVVSAEPAARALTEPLRALGVDVSTTANPAEVAGADLGVTSAVAAVAVTGSLVVDCAVAGGRTVSLLPRVHLCVVAAEALVATPGAVLRPLRAGRLPSNLVLISGPSRTGDIEQLLTIGVHGPVAVHVVLRGA